MPALITNHDCAITLALLSALSDCAAFYVVRRAPLARLTSRRSFPVCATADIFSTTTTPPYVRKAADLAWLPQPTRGRTKHRANVYQQTTAHKRRAAYRCARRAVSLCHPLSTCYTALAFASRLDARFTALSTLHGRRFHDRATCCRWQNTLLYCPRRACQLNSNLQ